jgi:predicted PurR-regulated permease PerM
VVVPAGLAYANVFLAVIIIAVLDLARDVIVPVVLAVFLTFVLAPLVSLLQRCRFPRSVAVVLSVTAAFAVLFVLGMMVLTQIRQLADDLPRYQTTLSEKVHRLHETVIGSGLISKGSLILKDMTKALDSPERGSSVDTSSLSDAGNTRKPIPVEVHQPDPGTADTLVSLLRPLVSPITTTSIIIVFVVFFLFQREDLRNRFIRLVGTGDLERTTTALDDAGRRLTRFFLTQLVVNSVFGIVIGIGLAVIGIPSASLWGLFAMVLRFVPYLGAILSAVIPSTLAAAVGPDWTMLLWTAALFAIVEALTGQLIEPLVYGKSAGLSPVAIVVAAAFWTWLWGPLGLLISTPLTLCMVVMARHVEQLAFIDIMLGDQPALTPQQSTYQRMLAGDPVEAIEHAHLFLKDNSRDKYDEEILLGALRLAQTDAQQGRLDEKRLDHIMKTISEIVDDLEHSDRRECPRTSVTSKNPVSTDAVGNIVALPARTPVSCVAGMGHLDETAALIVADALKRRGFTARAVGAGNTSDVAEHDILCICFLENVTEARIRYTMRRFARQPNKRKIVVTLLGTPTTDVESNYPTTLAETLAAFSSTGAASF